MLPLSATAAASPTALLEPPADAEEVAGPGVVVFKGIGDDVADGAPELEAVPTPAAGDEDRSRPGGPVDDEVTIGGVLIQAGAASDHRATGELGDPGSDEIPHRLHEDRAHGPGVVRIHGVPAQI